ncbi:MAG: metallopeptidase TldD-related protein, partial [Rhodothermales bacterium]
LIESGRLGAPVTSLRIEGRPSEVLQRVEGIADDVQFDSAREVCVKGGQRVDVALGAPTVLINRLSVAPIAP